MRYLLILLILCLALPGWAADDNPQISQSTDDGRVLSGAWSSVQSSDMFGNANIFGTCSSALRFQTSVPQGAVILMAYLTIYIQTANTGVLAICSGIDEDNTATFSATPFGRDHTTASISCGYDDWDSDSGWANSNSLVDVIQEIVDRPGFSSNIGILIEDNSSTESNVIEYVSYDYGGGASEFAAKLYIEWGTKSKLSGTFSIGN